MSIFNKIRVTVSMSLLLMSFFSSYGARWSWFGNNKFNKSNTTRTFSTQRFIYNIGLRLQNIWKGSPFSKKITTTTRFTSFAWMSNIFGKKNNNSQIMSDEKYKKMSTQEQLLYELEQIKIADEARQIKSFGEIKNDNKESLQCVTEFINIIDCSLYEKLRDIIMKSSPTNDERRIIVWMIYQTVSRHCEHEFAKPVQQKAYEQLPLKNKLLVDLDLTCKYLDVSGKTHQKEKDYIKTIINNISDEQFVQLDTYRHKMMKNVRVIKNYNQVKRYLIEIVENNSKRLYRPKDFAPIQ